MIAAALRKALELALIACAVSAPFAGAIAVGTGVDCSAFLSAFPIFAVLVFGALLLLELVAGSAIPRRRCRRCSRRVVNGRCRCGRGLSAWELAR